MSQSLNKEDKVPTYVNGIKIKMSVAVKMSAEGKLEFWVVQAGANIEKLTIQEHELNLTFGEDGRQRVADLNNNTLLTDADFNVDVLLPANVMTAEKVKLIAIPVSVNSIYTRKTSDTSKFEPLTATTNNSWRLNSKWKNKLLNEENSIAIEDSNIFTLVEQPNIGD